MNNKPTYEELVARIQELERMLANKPRKADWPGCGQMSSFSHDKLRELADQFNDAIYFVDHEGIVSFVSPQVETMLGISSDQIIGENFLNFIHPGDRDDIKLAFSDALQGRIQPGEYRLRTKSEEYLWIRTSSRPVCENNNLVGFQGVLIDITEHKKFEESFKLLFREMLDGFALHEFIFDDEGNPLDYRFLDVNPAFERMTGRKREGVVGKTVKEVFPETEPIWIEKYGQVTLNGEPVLFESYSQAIGRHFRVSAFRPAKNQFACLFVDITDLKQAESHLRQAQKMEALGALASGIAHDFNNILFPIMGLSELLLEDLALDSKEKEYVKGILGAGSRGTELVKQILAFSRQTEQKKLPIRVQLVVKEVFKLARSTIPANINISLNIQKDCGMVIVDPTQLHQVVMNLITNAYHAVEPTGGQITMQLKEVDLDGGAIGASDLGPGRYALLSVTDTGCGIPPEARDKIFEPYFTTKEKGKGTGLGLAVVYGIVKEHNGEIEIYSEVESGTTFNVYLPIAQEPMIQRSAKPVETYPTGTERILLVDDDQQIVALESQMLNRLGYSIESRTSSVEALQAFKANPGKFDLVLSDLTMPNMTGDQLAKELIMIRSDIPIIICTGFSEDVTDQKLKTSGVKGILMKPIIKSEMAKTVRRVLDAAKE